VAKTVQELKRSFLLWTSFVYGVLATAVPTTLLSHRHLAPQFAAAAGATALLLLLEVLRVQELGDRRARLASGLLLAGPLGPLLLARRTRRWQPLLMVRPRPANRR
jgi:hypothetical protein